MPAKGFRYPLYQRFWDKVDRSGDCWIWTAYRNRKGYGQFRIDGIVRRAHRVAYELEVGEIPEGMTIDHLCRNPSCVNPEHLEVVSNFENTLRGDNFIAHYVTRIYCKRGHKLSDENLYVSPRGKRECAPCRKERRTHGMRNHWAGSGCR